MRSHVGAGNQQGSPREQQMLLTAEPSPQPLVQTLKAPKDAHHRYGSTSLVLGLWVCTDCQFRANLSEQMLGTQPSTSYMMDRHTLS